MHEIKKLNQLVLNRRMTQKKIAEYLGLTRQSLSKIFKDEYVSISDYTRRRFKNLYKDGELDIDYAESMIKLNISMNLLIDKIKVVNTSEVENLNELLKNIMYWIDKNPNGKYMEKLNMQVQNFHLRINPFYLYFREYFHKDLQPLLTFQVDHKNMMVYDIVLGNVVNENYLEKDYDLNYQLNWIQQFNTELYFENFIEALTKFYDGKLRYTIFDDPVDSDFQFIEENVSKKTAMKMKKLNFLDISRMFQLPAEKYTIEQILKNFIGDIDTDNLLKNSKHRNDQIIKLIRILCEYDMKNNHDINSIFKVVDSESYDKSKAKSREIIERRKRSDRSYERNKD